MTPGSRHTAAKSTQLLLLAQWVKFLVWIISTQFIPSYNVEYFQWLLMNLKIGACSWLSLHNTVRRLQYLLGKGGYVFGSVGLSVCLSVCLDHITQKVMNGLVCLNQWSFTTRCGRQPVIGLKDFCGIWPLSHSYRELISGVLRTAREHNLRAQDVANFCAAMDTFIDEEESGRKIVAYPSLSSKGSGGSSL